MRYCYLRSHIKVTCYSFNILIRDSFDIFAIHQTMPCLPLCLRMRRPIRYPRCVILLASTASTFSVTHRWIKSWQRNSRVYSRSKWWGWCTVTIIIRTPTYGYFVDIVISDDFLRHSQVHFSYDIDCLIKFMETRYLHRDVACPTSRLSNAARNVQLNKSNFFIHTSKNE